jgi:hypothetical protein
MTMMNMPENMITNDLTQEQWDALSDAQRFRALEIELAHKNMNRAARELPPGQRFEIVRAGPGMLYVKLLDVQ